MRTATPAAAQTDEKMTDSPRPSPGEIIAQIREILSSPAFQGSKRGQQFLEFVCNKALAGEANALKERTIATEVFGRNPESGLGEDTIVRVGAREVRKRLAQYYVSPEGAAASVVVELPSGSYVPEFRHAVVSPAKAPIAPEVISVSPPALAPRKARVAIQTRRAVAGIAILLIVAAVFASLRWRRAAPPEKAFLAFWGPMLAAPDPVLIGISNPLVYLPSRKLTQLSESRLAPTPYPMQRRIELPPNALSGADMLAVENQYVGFGDMVAADEVSQMLARHGRRSRTLFASSVPFADLRRSPVYLVGLFTNRWTMEFGQSWRFRFAWTAEHVPIIEDTQPGSRRQWAVKAKDDGSTTEDFSMIARIKKSPTGGLVIVSAGIKQFGTEAAGRLLADPEELGNILNKLPAGWEDRNVQIVLHNRVMGNTPAQPEVVASWVW